MGGISPRSLWFIFCGATSGSMWFDQGSLGSKFPPGKVLEQVAASGRLLLVTVGVGFVCPKRDGCIAGWPERSAYQMRRRAAGSAPHL